MSCYVSSYFVICGYSYLIFSSLENMERMPIFRRGIYPQSEGGKSTFERETDTHINHRYRIQFHSQLLLPISSKTIRTLEYSSSSFVWKSNCALLQYFDALFVAIACAWIWIRSFNGLNFLTRDPFSVDRGVCDGGGSLVVYWWAEGWDPFHSIENIPSYILFHQPD